MRKHEPLGPAGTWKTGQRVPETGHYADQYGLVQHFEIATTFPPCMNLDDESECAYRIPLTDEAEATA
ncbi:hypothetical protein [Embleya sp. NPDC001921]